MSSRSLFNYMNRTKTGYGKRLLKKWLENPLRNINEINERLDGIEDFNKNSSMADYFHSEITKFPDFERALGKIYNATNKNKLAYSSFDNFASNNLNEFFKLLNDFEKVTEIIKGFEEWKGKFKSKRLKKLVTINYNKSKNEQGLFPNLLSLKSEIEEILDHKDDIVVPKEGINEKYDEISKKVKKAQTKLNEIIIQLRKKLKCEDLIYNHNKIRKYEIEVPEALKPKVPEEYFMTSKKKG